jgi:hypothetical protein
MRIPARFAPILFSALLSVIMVGIVSAFALTISQGVHPGFAAQWLKSLRNDMARRIPDGRSRGALGAANRQSRDRLIASQRLRRSMNDHAAATTLDGIGELQLHQFEPLHFS